MGKIRVIILFLLYFSLVLEAKNTLDDNIYTKECLKCHKQMSLSMQEIFMSYLKKYSSEVSVKSALIDFLKNPNYFTSALRKEQIARYGLKNKTILKDEELRKAIDIYWEKYKIFGKLQ